MEETKRAMQNVINLLEANGSSITDLIRVTIYLDDINDFAIVDETYRSFFPENGPYPARACFAVWQLPKEAKIEIAVEAVIEK